MKAEHRRELETNVLADRMGRAVQSARGTTRRTYLFVVAAFLVAAVGLFVAFRWVQVRRVEESQRWRLLEDGSHRFIETLVARAPETEAGKAARFQKAWFYFWELGLKRLGNDPVGALKKLDEAAVLYRQLAEDVKDDPVLEPEALYALAVIEETKAIQKRENLDEARRRYEEVAKFQNSAHGKLAAEWLEMYTDPARRQALASFYQDMQINLRVPEQGALPKGLDQFQFGK